MSTEGRVERGDERVGAEHMLEVVIPRAVMRGVLEGRGLRAGLTGEVAQPEHPLAGGVANGRPERPSLGRWAERQLLVGHRSHDVAESPVVLRLHAVGRSDGLVAHAVHRTPRSPS